VVPSPSPTPGASAFLPRSRVSAPPILSPRPRSTTYRTTIHAGYLDVLSSLENEGDFLRPAKRPARYPQVRASKVEAGHDAADCLDERHLADGSEVPRPSALSWRSHQKNSPRHQLLAVTAAVSASPHRVRVTSRLR
jgi:hypothetical protein